MNVFPPILTNRSTQPISSRSPQFQESAIIGPSEDMEISHGNQQNSNTQIPSDSKEIPKTKFYFKYSQTKFDEEDLIEEEEEEREQSPFKSEASDFVGNEWDELEEGVDILRSREAQEAELQDRYREAVCRLKRGEVNKAVSMFISILMHPLMPHYHVSDWSVFEQTKFKETEDKMMSNMSKTYFCVNLVMCGLANNPVPFYMQALSIRPDLKDLWFNCGQAAAKHGDWRSAEFCFSCCIDEFRTLEALLLVYFMSQDYLKCSSILKKIFYYHPEHYFGHVIRQLIATESSIWTLLHCKMFSDEILRFKIDKNEEKKILDRLSSPKLKYPDSFNNSSVNIFQRTSPEYSYFVVRLWKGIKIGELGKLLCDLYDRIERYSSFVEQKIFFVIDDGTEKNMNAIERTSERIELDCSDKQQALMEEVEEIQKLAEEVVALETQSILDGSEGDLMQRLIDQISNGSVLDSGNALQETETDGEAKNDDIMETNALEIPSQDEGSENVMHNADSGNSSDKTSKTKKKEIQTRSKPAVEADLVGSETVEESLRRSLRLVDEPWFVGSPAQRSDRKWTVLKMMGIDEIDTQKESFCSSKTHFNLETFEPLPISALDDFIAQLVEKVSHFSHHLYRFLKWIAVKQSAEQILTLEEAEIYRQVYIRWSALNVRHSDLPYLAESDLAVHQLAAELGCHQALSVLQSYYERNNIGKNSKVTDESIELETTKREESKDSGFVGQNFELKTGNAVDQMTKLSSNLDLVRCVLKNIASENHDDDRKELSVRHHRLYDKLPGIDGCEPGNYYCKSFNCPTNLLLNLEIRYRWLIANLRTDELGLIDSSPISFAHTYVQLSSALNLAQPEWRLFSHADFEIGCLTKRNLEEVLRKKVCQFQSKQIDFLADSKCFNELKDVLLNHYDWKTAAEDGHVKQMFLLIKCFQETGENLETILDWLNRVLSLLCLNELTGAQAKRTLRRSLNLLNEILPSAEQEIVHLFSTNSTVIISLGRMLGQLTQSDKFPQLARATDLWLWCYRIGKVVEADLSAAKLIAFYEECDSVENLVSHRLPTRSLMILGRAHEVLGKARKCSRKEGRFLHIIIDEYAQILGHEVVAKLLAVKKYEDVRENANYEIIHCLHCAFSQNFAQTRARSRFADHGSKLQWEASWELALRVLPLIAPLCLPEINSDKRVPNDFVEILNKVFGHLLPVEQSRLEKFDEFCNNSPQLDLVEQFDSDGICYAYGKEMKMSEEGSARLLGISDQQAGELGNEKLKESMRAQWLYLLAHFHHRSGQNTTGEVHFLKKCLAVGGTHLPPNILASAWHALGRALTYQYAIQEDTELLEKVQAFLLPFKMAVYLNPEFAEAHLDLGTLVYQLRTRFYRFKDLADINPEIKRKAQQKMEGFLLRCKVHFRLARQYDEYDRQKGLAWLTTYFLGKIGEKLGESAETILELYYQSALDLENEGLQYQTKINRNKQTYLEPLEIHYRVHSYALHRLEFLVKSIGLSIFTIGEISRELQIIHSYLLLFQHHGVQHRSSLDPHKSADEFYDIDKLHKDINKSTMAKVQDQDSSLAHDVMEQFMLSDVTDLADHWEPNLEKKRAKKPIAPTPKVDSVVDVVAICKDINRLCLHAFEVILQRFPHYKAAYRIAYAHFKEKNFKHSASILFEKLFMASRKQRPANFLENIVEIKRTDIERNGSFPYHLQKIIKLAGLAAWKAEDIEKLKDMIFALTAYKSTANPTSISREFLNESTIKELLALNVRWFKKTAEEVLRQMSGTISGKEQQSIERLNNIIEQIEGVVGRLKKNRRYPPEELETLLIAYIRRRDQLAPRADEDIIPLMGPELPYSPSKLNRFSNLPGQHKKQTLMEHSQQIISFNQNSQKQPQHPVIGIASSSRTYMETNRAIVPVPGASGSGGRQSQSAVLSAQLELLQQALARFKQSQQSSTGQQLTSEQLQKMIELIKAQLKQQNPKPQLVHPTTPKQHSSAPSTSTSSPQIALRTQMAPTTPSTSAACYRSSEQITQNIRQRFNQFSRQSAQITPEIEQQIKAKLLQSSEGSSRPQQQQSMPSLATSFTSGALSSQQMAWTSPQQKSRQHQQQNEFSTIVQSQRQQKQTPQRDQLPLNSSILHSVHTFPLLHQISPQHLQQQQPPIQPLSTGQQQLIGHLLSLQRLEQLRMLSQQIEMFAKNNNSRP